MDSLAFWFYAIDVADALNGFFRFAAIVAGLGSVLAVLIALGMTDQNCNENEWRTWRRCVTLAAVIFFPSLLLTIIIPQEKTLYMMLGAKTAQDIVANPKVQQVGGKVMDLINKKLETLASDEIDIEPKKKGER